MILRAIATATAIVSALILPCVPLHSATLAASEHSDDQSSCEVVFALVNLRDGPLISSESPSLAARGLIPRGQASLLCGPTCVHYVLKVLRKALRVPSVFSSPSDEVAYLSRLGAQDVVNSGTKAHELKSMLLGDLEMHGIRAGVDLLPKVTEFRPYFFGPAIQRRARLEIGDLVAPEGKEQISILLVDGGGGGGGGEMGHLFLIEYLDARSGMVSLIDPATPQGKIYLQLLHPDPRDSSSPLLLVSPALDETKVTDWGQVPSIRVREVLRVRVPAS